MFSDYRFRYQPRAIARSSPMYAYDIYSQTGTADIADLMTRRIKLQHPLASDIFQRSTLYEPIRSWSLTGSHQNFHDYHAYRTKPVFSRSISPIALPRLSFDYHQPLLCHTCRRYDFSRLNLTHREPSFFPPAHNSYRLQTDYDRFHARPNRVFRRRWKTVGLVLMFYFYLRNNLRLAKQMDTYYQRDYRRIRFLELLTAVHRVYLEPRSPIYKALSTAVHSSSILLSQETLFACVESIINQITNFVPSQGILGTNSDDSVLIYLLTCPLEQYPATYFWSIERHLLSMSYSKMKENRHEQLDHFSTKFLLISTFIFRCLTKTLLLKPVKYRLARGQLNQIQWLNTRRLSTLLLYTARHAIMYKHEQNRLPMPFPLEMKKYLLDDDRVRESFRHVDELIDATVPKLSAWACEYADRLQQSLSTIKWAK